MAGVDRKGTRPATRSTGSQGELPAAYHLADALRAKLARRAYGPPQSRRAVPGDQAVPGERSGRVDARLLGDLVTARDARVSCRGGLRASPSGPASLYASRTDAGRISATLRLRLGE